MRTRPCNMAPASPACSRHPAHPDIHIVVLNSRHCSSLRCTLRRTSTSNISSGAWRRATTAHLPSPSGYDGYRSSPAGPEPHRDLADDTAKQVVKSVGKRIHKVTVHVHRRAAPKERHLVTAKRQAFLVPADTRAQQDPPQLLRQNRVSSAPLSELSATQIQDTDRTTRLLLPGMHRHCEPHMHDKVHSRRALAKLQAMA